MKQENLNKKEVVGVKADTESKPTPGSLDDIKNKLKKGIEDTKKQIKIAEKRGDGKVVLNLEAGIREMETWVQALDSESGNDTEKLEAIKSAVMKDLDDLIKKNELSIESLGVKITDKRSADNVKALNDVIAAEVARTASKISKKIEATQDGKSEKKEVEFKVPVVGDVISVVVNGKLDSGWRVGSVINGNVVVGKEGMTSKFFSLDDLREFQKSGENKSEAGKKVDATINKIDKIDKAVGVNESNITDQPADQENAITNHDNQEKKKTTVGRKKETITKRVKKDSVGKPNADNQPIAPVKDKIDIPAGLNKLTEIHQKLEDTKQESKIKPDDKEVARSATESEVKPAEKIEQKQYNAGHEEALAQWRKQMAKLPELLAMRGQFLLTSPDTTLKFLKIQK